MLRPESQAVAGPGWAGNGSGSKRRMWFAHLPGSRAGAAGAVSAPGSQGAWRKRGVTSLAGPHSPPAGALLLEAAIPEKPAPR